MLAFVCSLIFKGDNNRVMFLSSPQYRIQLSVKHFFCGKEKLNLFLFSFPKLFMLLHFSAGSGGEGWGRQERVAHVRCIGNREQG